MRAQHRQRLVRRLTTILRACRPLKTDEVEFNVGVSPLAAGWEHNYRIPDVSVVLTGNALVTHKTHYQGGPDLVVEVRSPGDRSLEKLAIYAELGVREVLVVGRDSREPTLFRLGRKKLASVKPTVIDGEPWLVSTVLPLAFARTEVKGKPKLLVRRTARGRPHVAGVTRHGTTSPPKNPPFSPPTVISICRRTHGTRGSQGRHTSRPQPRTGQSLWKNGDRANVTAA